AVGVRGPGIHAPPRGKHHRRAHRRDGSPHLRPAPRIRAWHTPTAGLIACCRVSPPYGAAARRAKGNHGTFVVRQPWPSDEGGRVQRTTDRCDIQPNPRSSGAHVTLKIVPAISPTHTQRLRTPTG